MEEAEVCSIDSECCDAGQGSSVVNQYCSTRQYENLEEGHCCEEGTFWNSIDLTCERAETCYDPENPLGDPTICNYLPSNPYGYFHLDEENCIQFNPLFEYYEACCNKNIYGGTNNFYFCEIEAL